MVIITAQKRSNRLLIIYYHIDFALARALIVKESYKSLLAGLIQNHLPTHEMHARTPVHFVLTTSYLGDTR
jgi:hypothetical protein